MLVTSSQSSTQRPLGLSVDELFALDRQYRRIEQQQHLAQLQTQTRLASSNLNRLTSRSLDLVSSPTDTPLPVLPSLEIHGHGYNGRAQAPSSSSVLHYPRSNSIDQLRQAPPVLPPAPPKLSYPQRSTSNDPVLQNYHSRYRSYMQPSTMATGPAPTIGSHFMYNTPSSSPSTDYYDPRNPCKLRRQHPVKRESSRRILVRPVVQRRREPSISSSCESLDEPRSPVKPIPTEQSNFSSSSVSFTPSSSLITNVIENLEDAKTSLPRRSSHNESFSDENEVNLYEMRISIGKTYDTSDISVQLEGPRILVYCHTIEPTDKRGNYRKHEFKTELLVPDVVDDETIVAYLTEDGQLIVEGKYHAWAWREIQQKRKLEQQESQSALTPVLSPPVPTPSSAPVSSRNDGGLDRDKATRPAPPPSNQSQRTHPSAPTSRIEKLDNNRTMIHVGESTSTAADSKTVGDMISRFNTLHGTYAPSIGDGQYSFTNDLPPLLHYHVRLPSEASMDSVRIQPDPQTNILKVYTEPQERSSSAYEQQNNRLTIRSIPRICRLPRDFNYDYTHLRVVFLRDNFIRIEVPTLN